MQEPDNIEHRQAFVRIEKEKSDLMDKFTQKLIESQMRYMSEKIKPGTRKFFKITEKLLAKDKFSENSTDTMSESERKERLEKNDKTFFNAAQDLVTISTIIRISSPNLSFPWINGIHVPGVTISRKFLGR